MAKAITVDINEAIGTISLNRPNAMNTYNEEMALDLLRAFESLDNNKAVRVILLRGEGKAFCAGGDIKMFADKLSEMPGNIPDMMEVLNTTISSMLAAKKPILAVVHGSVAGVGMSFMMACDLVIAAEDTKFTMAYAGIGLTADGGASYLLPRIVGQRRATQMLLMPEVFSAKHALDIGLINWVASEKDIEATTTKLLSKLANGPTLVYKRIKHLLCSTWEKELDDQLLAEMYAFTECCSSKDFARGVRAFLQKEAPKFAGD